MKIERTEAIILHAYQARERDKVIVFLTPDHGKRKALAYGARAIRSRFGAALEPLAKIRIGYSEREGEELLRVDSVDLVRSLFPAQQTLPGSVAATYIAEMIDTFAPSDDPAELMYRLLDRACEALLGGDGFAAIVAYVEIWMLKLAGIFPSLRQCQSCGDALSRPVRYDAQMQAFVCGNCGGRDTHIVSNDAVEAIELIGRVTVQDLVSRRLPPDTIFEVRSLAGDIRRAFLGHELKSFEVLTGVLAR